ncbi:hypothetical protein CMI47_09915 [Candidatus Pacearchaeota archaeon]|jgi:ribosomal protein S15P/S13E|nr:hypothetical protein [Candidatus Pacearchaeota archaeon]|tara:strand:- start:5144 stop:5362 length:219 start_codon:yes stop_codon:yes gene_type:complete
MNNDVYYHDPIAHMRMLELEIEIIRSRIQKHNTGHLYTAINVLENRIEELEKHIKDALKDAPGIHSIRLGIK